MGQGELFIEGLELPSASLSFDAKFETQTFKETEEGNLVGTETGFFDFGSGDTFTELDRFTFGPSEDDPELFHFNDVGRITEGTRMFQTAYGKLEIQGFATFPEGAEPEFSGTLKGRICGVE